MIELWKPLTCAVTLAAAGWGAHEYLSETYAASADVKVVQAQTQFVLDRQMSALVAEISYLERKPNKTPADFEQLRWLREQLAEMRRVRSGK